MLHYVDNHRIDVVHNRRRWYPQLGDALCGKPAVSYLISLRMVAQVMGHPVNLDRQLGTWTAEIEDEGADGVLPAKTHVDRL